MNCKKCKEHLPAWLDRELSGELADQLQEHLKACPDCTEQRALLEQGLAGLDGLEQLEPSADFDAAFALKLQDAKRAKRLEEQVAPRRSWFQTWRLPLLATAGACAALLAVVLLQDPPPAPEARVPDLELAQNLTLLQDYEVVSQLDALEDFELISQLDALEEEL